MGSRIGTRAGNGLYNMEMIWLGLIIVTALIDLYSVQEGRKAKQERNSIAAAITEIQQVVNGNADAQRKGLAYLYECATEVEMMRTIVEIHSKLLDLNLPSREKFNMNIMEVKS
jgi:hypothetical protein